MAIARVVEFEGVSKERMDEMNREMEGGERPDDVPATEIIVLHDAEAEKSLVILFFDSEDDYVRGHAALDAMPAGEPPADGRRCGKYDVAARMAE